jgi:hypothetical protein
MSTESILAQFERYLNAIQVVVIGAPGPIYEGLVRRNKALKERAILVPQGYIQIPKPLIPEDIP